LLPSHGSHVVGDSERSIYKEIVLFGGVVAPFDNTQNTMRCITSKWVFPGTISKGSGSYNHSVRFLQQ
jgi:hypothetical protein